MKVYAIDGVDEYLLTKRDTHESAIRWVDCVLCATAKVSLLSALNDVQTYCEKDGATLFPSKFEIPLYIVNLILAKYNLKIEEDGK